MSEKKYSQDLEHECVCVCVRKSEIMRLKKRARDQSAGRIWNVEGLLVSRLEYAIAKTCSFITWAKGQVRAKEPVPGDEYHPTVPGPNDLRPYEEEAQLIGFWAEMSAAVTKLTK